MDIIRQELKTPRPMRLWYVADAFRAGMSIEDIFELSYIDPWFLVQIEELVQLENEVKAQGIEALDKLPGVLVAHVVFCNVEDLAGSEVPEQRQ